MRYLWLHAHRVADLGVRHIILVACALAAALLVALPLGVVASRGGRGSSLLLGVLGAIYTIPSLALLALLVEAFGLGTAPIFIALVAYAQFILVRNIATGLRGVDPAQRDAGCAMGMSAWQLLLHVELPLALPVIVGGVRIAAIAMVALATLGAYVGARDLGTLIFDGLALHHLNEIVAGSTAAAALAIVVDIALRLAQRRLRSD
jgi:osmoprotectant transport system permease protein